MTEVIYCVLALLLGFCSYYSGFVRGFGIGAEEQRRVTQEAMKKAVEELYKIQETEKGN